MIRTLLQEPIGNEEGLISMLCSYPQLSPSDHHQIYLIRFSQMLPVVSVSQP